MLLWKHLHFYALQFFLFRNFMLLSYLRIIQVFFYEFVVQFMIQNFALNKTHSDSKALLNPYVIGAYQ